MTRVLRYRIIPLIAIIALMSFLFYAAAGFFLQDRLVTDEVGLMLQKSLQGTGLQLTIGKIHWAGINRITATKFIFQDLHHHSHPISGKTDSGKTGFVCFHQ